MPLVKFISDQCIEPFQNQKVLGIYEFGYLKRSLMNLDSIKPEVNLINQHRGLVSTTQVLTGTAVRYIYKLRHENPAPPHKTEQISTFPVTQDVPGTHPDTLKREKLIRPQNRMVTITEKLSSHEYRSNSNRFFFNYQ